MGRATPLLPVVEPNGSHGRVLAVAAAVATVAAACGGQIGDIPPRHNAQGHTAAWSTDEQRRSQAEVTAAECADR